MGIGAVFLLVIVIIVLSVLGAGLYVLAMRLRSKQLDPEGDKLEGHSEEPAHPQHIAVENEQRARFVGGS